MGCWGPPGGQSCRENALSDFTAYFTTFFRKKIHPPMGFSTSSEILVEKPRFFALFSLPGKGGFRMCFAAALHIFSGRIILNRATPGGLRTARCGVFTGGAGAVSGRTRACFLRKQLPWENPLRPFFPPPQTTKPGGPLRTARLCVKRSCYSSILPKLKSAKSSTRSVRLGATGAAVSASRGA